MAGAGYKLFTTGQVLTAAEVNTYLQEQVIMVFNDAASRTTALSGVLAEGMVSYLKSTKVVEIYNGTAWASLDDPNAIQNTIVDAKGDLISASGNDVPARLAVGNNGETLVADSSTTTGLRYTTPVASLANPVINGGFDIWQRGTSFSGAGTSGSFSADRWSSGRSNQAWTITRQTTGDTTNLPNIQYCARVQRDSGNTNTSTGYIIQNFETSNTLPYVGKTVTMSFYARGGANYSPTSNALRVLLVTGTGTDQSGWSTYTGGTNIIDQDVTLTTTWQRFAISVAIPSTVTEMYPGFQYNPVGTAGANDYFEITGVQIDLGTYTASTAPAFRRSGGTLAGELQAAQRYYFRNTTGKPYGALGWAQAYSTTATRGIINLPVPMRVVPTSIDQGNLILSLWGVGDYTFSGITLIGDNSTPYTAVFETTGATGLTAQRSYNLASYNNTAGYIGFSAEL